MKIVIQVGFDNPSSNIFSNNSVFKKLWSKLSDHVCTACRWKRLNPFVPIEAKGNIHFELIFLRKHILESIGGGNINQISTDNSLSNIL